MMKPWRAHPSGRRHDKETKAPHYRDDDLLDKSKKSGMRQGGKVREAMLMGWTRREGL